VYRESKHITRDMNGTASTGEFADAVIEAMQYNTWRQQAASETNPV
jgi:hypothetical protein